MGIVRFDGKRENRQILLSFAQSIQERDIVTYDHSRRVATYAQRLARYMGWSRHDARDLALASLVHDLGKTWIVNDILNKSAALSDEERRTMERHPIIGARILIGCDIHPFYVEAVLYHHEAWNGRGYPTRLRGEEIPMSARMLSVADVYDVLTSQRPYKEALSMEAARERILMGSGTSFDPTVVRAFIELLDFQPDFTLPQRVCPLPVQMRVGAQPGRPQGDAPTIYGQPGRPQGDAPTIYVGTDLPPAGAAASRVMISSAEQFPESPFETAPLSSL